MDNILIEGNKQQPTIDFDAQTGQLSISGRSIPENSYEFYNPLLLWLDDYKENAMETTKVKIHLEYFNTSSSKYILEVLKKIKEMHAQGKNVEIAWHYDEDDEEMMETGEDYEDIIGIDFNYIAEEE
ncbi:MAG: nuclear pore complex subunit [Bacteroidetes bacterium 4572_77]|nr:MAG: nuclear pore complex subunit [Bacteroidetes bacterium 4572_77]